MENAADIEFQRVHRVGNKMTGETRPVIVGFLKFPECELVFRRVRELADDIDIKVYVDFPNAKEESSGHVLKKQERRKRLLSLANQNLINCLSMDDLFPYRQI